MPAETTGLRPSTIDQRLAAAGLPPLPRRVWLEIDEEALASNLGVIRDLVGPAVTINAVVKADAYGHGLLPVARVFEKAGADRLCVASIDEALAVRGAGVNLPILILFPIPPAEAARAAQARFEVVAAEESSTLALLGAWSSQRASDAQLPVHLEVETGLGRGGLAPDAVAGLARRIVDPQQAQLAGLWTHLARSDNEAASAAQVAAFERATEAIRNAGLAVPKRHMSATGGVFGASAPIYDGVRVGLALYGLLPTDFPIAEQARAAAARLRPVMALKCRALRIERVAAGTAVSYGGLWVAQRESLIATLPVGYGDGLARAYSPGAQATVGGTKVSLVGSVAMDAVMADVTDVPRVSLEDEFILLGIQDGIGIVTSELARVRNTIPWEVVTSMAHRLPRVYHAGSVLLGLRTMAGESRASPT
jgi:alanine racemase